MGLPGRAVGYRLCARCAAIAERRDATGSVLPESLGGLGPRHHAHGMPLD